MGFMRIYSGDDGESHIEEMDLESHPSLTELHTVTGIVFRQYEPGHFSDWHHAPRRQYVITIQGEGDGTIYRFGPGHVTLAEDLTGRGHTTRVVGNVPRITASVPLGD